MQFIRDNMFLVILAGVVVVIGGALLAGNASLTGNVDDSIGEKNALIKSLTRLGTIPLVNEHAVESEEQRVESIENASGEVSILAVEWNRANYEVIRLQIDPNTVIEAFPIDPNIFERYTLVWDFTEEYLRRLEQLQNSLKPTSPPTKVEKDAAIAREQLRLEREKLRLEEEEGDEDIDTPITTRPPRSMELTSVVKRKAKAGVVSETEKRGTNAARVTKASAGLIYVSPDAMAPVFPEPRNKAEYEELWQAQVDLWVTGDIIAAITETNRQGLLRPDGASVRAIVPNATIKRLVKINITKNYAGAKDSGGPAKRASNLSVAIRPRTFGPPGGGRFPVPRGMGGAPGFRGDQPAAKRTALTGRATTKAYDVVNYDFTVTMPTRNVVALIRNLTRRGNNTVLKVSMLRPEDRDDDYYYGTDAVMEVTIEAEVLFLSQWYRPLMPDAVLEQLPPTALRPEDSKRIKPVGKPAPSVRSPSRRGRRR